MIVIGATALALTLGGTVMAQDSSPSQGCTPIPPVDEPVMIPQPDGSEPVPPVVEPVMIPQPDGSEPVPPFVEAPVLKQPGTLRIVDGVACVS